jgi:hypothetical protein
MNSRAQEWPAYNTALPAALLLWDVAALAGASSASPFVFQELVAGNFSPRRATGSVQVEQSLSEHLRLRVGYMQNQSAGLVILNRVAPDPATNIGNLPADLPNRFLAWGLLQLPWGFQVAPLFEFRSGFPSSVIDATQNYVGTPNSSRFPSFLSVDSRFSKDFKVSPNYTVRLSVSGYNLTNRFNPEAFHNNVADPACGYFFGQRGRRFTADFDVIF